MSQGVKIDMTNDNALISIAMLSTFFEKKKKDYIDLGCYYALNLFPKSIGSLIDKDELRSKILSDYGLDFPANLINKILRRCCKQKYLKYNNDDTYSVQTPYDSKDFIDEKISLELNMKMIIDKLKSYFQEDHSYRDISSKDVEGKFGYFIENYALPVYQDTTKLRTIPCSNKDAFKIYKFISQEEKEKSAVFLAILKFVEGFFIYKAIFICEKDFKKDIFSKLKETEIYLDTNLLIKALGYYTEADKLAVLELIQLILESGGVVKTFWHLRDEVKGILKRFKELKLEDKLNSRLNYLLEKKYSDVDVDRLIITLDGNLAKLGISVVDTPDQNVYLKEKVDIEQLKNKGYIDEEELKKYLISNMNGNYSASQERVQNDITSLVAVSQLRGKHKNEPIESCKAILTTHNLGIERAGIKYGGRGIGLAINDLDLTAILWLRSPNKNSNLPCLTLIANSYAACRPTQEFIDTFIEKVNLLREEDKISEQQALLIRSNMVIREAIVESTHNEVSELNDKIVMDVISQYEENILKEKNLENDELKSQLKSTEQKLEIQIKKEKNRFNQKLEKIEYNTEENIRKSKESAKIAITWVTWIFIIFGVISLVIGLTEYIDTDSSKVYIIAFIVSLAFEIIGVISLKKEMQSYILNKINKIIEKKYYKYHDNEIEKIKEEFKLE